MSALEVKKPVQPTQHVFPIKPTSVTHFEFNIVARMHATHVDIELFTFSPSLNISSFDLNMPSKPLDGNV